MAFAPAAYAESYVCDLKPDGKRPLLFDSVELWIDTDDWRGQMRDAASKTVSPKSVEAKVQSLSPTKWEFSGVIHRVTVAANRNIDYEYRYRLNTKRQTVTLAATFIGNNVQQIETGASGACRKAR